MLSILGRSSFAIILMVVLLVMVIYNTKINVSDQLQEQEEYETSVLSEFHISFTQSVTIKAPSLCVVVRVEKSKIRHLPVLALSLYQTGLQNLRLYLLISERGSGGELLTATIKLINQLVNQSNYVLLLDLVESSFSDMNSSELTDRVLEYLYNQSKYYPEACTYIVFTNSDSYYSRSFGRRLLPHMKASTDIIAWSFVAPFPRPSFNLKASSSHENTPRMLDNRFETCVSGQFKPEGVTSGSIAYRLAFLKAHKLSYCSLSGLFTQRTDGDFVVHAATFTNMSVLLKQTLLIHQ
ncbi:unnamed protein product [Rotaria socialis]|uniref:Uncharacterized protein n=1 Tax=Rotaria socialis TaxID=392032 RepID=A0A820TC72_9BILA|nr:unnamed protein product [Rotaria socialis]CAF4468890.1 unnamed protein product [Rotaria socialis]